MKELLLLGVGELPSLEFLRGLHSLELFSMADKTVVRDGDLSVLLELPALKQVGVRERRHYSPPVAEIEAALAARHGTLADTN